MFSTTQRNGFFTAIQEVGFNPTDFTMSGGGGVAVTHRPTGFIFQVVHAMAGNRPCLVCSHTPDNSGLVASPNKYRLVANANSWEEVYGAFTYWLQYLKAEESVPDLWADAEKTARLFAHTTEPTDDKFTRTELAEVQGQLRQLQHSFEAAALPEAARQKLIELTTTAAEKAEGFTKKDWQGWFIGSVIGNITSLALDSAQAHLVYTLIKTAFSGLFLN